MVDEDFVMGYCVGYNDGVGSGGGSEWLDQIPVISHRWKLGNTGFTILLSDFNSDFFDFIPNLFTHNLYDSSGNKMGEEYHPDDYYKTTDLWIVVEKNGKRFLAATNGYDQQKFSKNRSFNKTKNRYVAYNSKYIANDDVNISSHKKLNSAGTQSTYSSTGYISLDYETWYDNTDDGEHKYFNSYTKISFNLASVTLDAASGEILNYPKSVFGDAIYNGCVCTDMAAYAELMTAFLSCPDIIEEV